MGRRGEPRLNAGHNRREDILVATITIAKDDSRRLRRAFQLQIEGEVQASLLALTLLFSTGWLPFASASAPERVAAGAVSLIDSEGRRPVRGARVTALRAGTNNLLRTVVTGNGGEFAFVSLPPERIVFQVSRPGYVTTSARGRNASQVVLDCRAAVDVRDLEFILGRGAAMNGLVVDELGEPVESASVSVVLEPYGQSGLDATDATDATDDRGVFRISGLPAGSYRLQATSPAGRVTLQTTTQAVRVGSGEELEGLRLILRAEPVLSVAGRIAGVESTAQLVSVVAERLPAPGRHFEAAIGTGGRFDLRLLPRGRYRMVGRARTSGAQPVEELQFGVVDIVRTTANLVLLPAEPSRLDVSLRVDAEPPPRFLQINLVSTEGLGVRRIRVDPSAPRFSIDGLPSGRYRAELSVEDLYLRDITQSEAATPEVKVSAGGSELELVLASNFGRVSGVIVDSTRERLPHGAAAVEGPRGLHVALADQNGFFLFERLVPGDYRVCTWRGETHAGAYNVSAWPSDCLGKRFTVDPGAEIELSLTASR